MSSETTPAETTSPKPKKKQVWIPFALIAGAILGLGIFVQMANQAEYQVYNNSSNYNGEEEQAMWTEEQKAIYREYKLKELEEIRRERRLRTAAPLAPDKMDPYYK